jgi:hypothetical protein
MTEISDAHLDVVVKAYKEKRPSAGIRYIQGFLLQHHVRVPRQRVASSIKRVDGLGQVLVRRDAIRRRQYTSSRPNALWHLDGHHKLILWGFVIHGIVDGYCRSVSPYFLWTQNPY